MVVVGRREIASSVFLQVQALLITGESKIQPKFPSRIDVDDANAAQRIKNEQVSK